MRIKARDKHVLPNGSVMPYTWVHVTLFMRLKLKLNSHCKIGKRMESGWRGYIDIFLVQCSTCHEYFIDYLHGFSRYFLCPRCDWSRMKVSARDETQTEAGFSDDCLDKS